LKSEVKLTESFTWLLKYLLPLCLLTGSIGFGYWKGYVEPRVDLKIKPIEYTVLENNFLLQEITTIEKREKARRKIQNIKRLREEMIKLV
jgi:hypothetical protein